LFIAANIKRCQKPAKIFLTEIDSFMNSFKNIHPFKAFIENKCFISTVSCELMCNQSIFFVAVISDSYFPTGVGQ